MSSVFSEQAGGHVERHSSRCLFCTLGCGFNMVTLRGEVLGLEYDSDSEVNRGSLCSKGNYIPGLIDHPFRLTEPVADDHPVSWTRALEDVAGRFTGNTSAVIIDGTASLEDIETARLFTRRCLGSDMFAVHVPTGDDAVVEALYRSGVSRLSVPRSEIEASRCILAIGDPFEIGPVVSGGILVARYRSRESMLAVVSDGPNRTSPFATFSLQGNVRRILAGLIHALCTLPAVKTPKWADAFAKAAPEPDDARYHEIASSLATGKPVIVLETQDPVIAGLAGALAVLAVPEAQVCYIGSYGNIGDIISRIERTRTMDEVFDAIESGKVKALLSLGTDLVAGCPGRDVTSLLGRLDTFVAGSPFENDTTRLAGTVLPTALWCEVDGTCCGGLLEAVVEPPGGALSFGEILNRLVSRMGTVLPDDDSEYRFEVANMTSERANELLEASGEAFTPPPVRSSTVRFADGSLSGKATFAKYAERGPV